MTQQRQDLSTVDGLYGRQRSLRRSAWLALACMAGLSGVAVAQVSTQGTITGVLTDPGNTALPNAHITVTDVKTNVSTEVQTNETGYYEVDNLNPDTYTITMSAEGFATVVRQGITLPTGGKIAVPMTMKYSSKAETVTVTADASLLNTESASNGQVLTTKQIEQLPASGANPMQMAQLAPGVQAPNSQIYSAGDTLSWNGVSKFGANGYLNGNEWILDGVNNMGNPRGNAVQLSEEEVDQMKVETISFEPEFGHTMGAMITQTTKSGGNMFHGTVHWFYQDSAWEAMEHFQGLSYRYQQSKSGCTDGADTSAACLLLKYKYGIPGTHTNISSFSLGGPVLIPHVFDGRNKLFFFVDVNNDVWSQAATGTTSVPTVQERSGDFSDLPVSSSVPASYTAACGTGAAYFGQYQLYNPFSVTLDAKGVPRRTPICGNVVPSNLMTTTATLSKFYNSLLPVPTQNSPTGSNYAYTTLASITYRQFTQRMDFAPTDRDHVYFRWSRVHYNDQQGEFLEGGIDREVSPKWIVLGAFGYNHIFSDRTDLNVTVGASSWKTGCCYYPGYEQVTAASVGLPSYIDGYGGGQPTLPIFSVGSYAQVGQENNSPQTFRNLSVSSVLNHVYHNHTIRAGAEWQQQSESQPAQGNTSGTFTFDDTYTQENNGTDSTYSQSTWGQSYAAFLMGIPTSSSIGQGYPVSIRTPYYALFVGDNWRVNRKLTIIPSIRFEYEFGPSEIHNAQIVGWDPNATLAIAGEANTAYQATLASATAAQKAVMPASLTIKGGPLYAGVNGAPTRQFINDHRLLPRLGFAYQVDSNTVVRGGYGLYTDTINAHDEGGSPHSAISPVGGTWSGVEFSSNQGGYSTSTTDNSSTTYGANFAQGSTPLSDPFPAVNGMRFDPIIGNAAGSLYYVGTSPTIYDHNMKPSRAQRWYVGLQHQFGSSTMVEVAYVGSWVKDIPISHSIDHAPEGLFTGGNQPNTAANALLSSQVTNPFRISNFGDLAQSNAAAYNRMALNSYFTAAKINLSYLLTADPQMTGFAMYQSLGESHFQELQFNLTRRYHSGLTLMGALQLNDQHDRDYFANVYDPAPSWEPSNNSMPYRVTGEALYELPFGHDREWLRNGIASKVLGGYQLTGSYERQPGPLLVFSNLFYIGTPNKDIKLKHPVYVNNQANGGSNYVQWLNKGKVTASYSGGTCTYTGTGFVTNSSCQPNSYNETVFPTRVNGVRAQATDTIQMGVQRKVAITERVGFEARIEAYNLLNRQVLGTPNVTPTSATFGQITADGGSNGSGNGRWLSIQGRLRF
ncbi:carboxypeptidase regulatory-like domain-containing protein [Silvibacterium acidisoli]|uniref:carboxypeptidase regulatory-like domain-containing protein n=1 Tax=Acidobacteriaceae bacterium ZG23-2 TaxID=2883246 RepID=UPI00406BF6A3